MGEKSHLRVTGQTVEQSLEMNKWLIARALNILVRMPIIFQVLGNYLEMEKKKIDDALLVSFGVTLK